jgi:hypothetical protein
MHAVDNDAPVREEYRPAAQLEQLVELEEI